MFHHRGIDASEKPKIYSPISVPHVSVVKLNFCNLDSELVASAVPSVHNRNEVL